jgi:hypothetical protein
VVVDVIYVERIAFREAKYYAPVGANWHRPEAFKGALKRVQPEDGKSISLNETAASSLARMSRSLTVCSPITPRGSSSS